MGVYRRKDSPYYWMWLEAPAGGRPKAESTKVYIDAPSVEQRRDNKRLATQLFKERQAAILRNGNRPGETPTIVPLDRSLAGWCYIYFVQTGDAVKIGRAVDLEKRLKTLQTAQAIPLTLLAAVPGHADLEGAIHDRFHHLKRKGEWFALAHDLDQFIERLRAGENPVALLW